MKHRITCDKGFTLIEVLVALIVLSIGLLGIGKLMLFSSRGNDSAYLRSQATQLAYSILDNMRSNRDQAIAGSYDIGFGAYGGSSPNCTSSSCTQSNVANFDLAQWKARLISATAGLGPTGDGSVTTNTVTDANGVSRTLATVVVQWNDVVAQQSFGSTATTASVTLQTIL